MLNESKLFYHLEEIQGLANINRQYSETSDTKLKDIRQSVELSDKRLERIAMTEYKQLEQLREINTNLSYILFLLILFGAPILGAVWKYFQ